MNEKSEYQKENQKQLNDLILLLIYNDLVKEKVGTKRKIQIFKNALSKEKGSASYSMFFDEILEENQSIGSYTKEKIKYIK